MTVWDQRLIDLFQKGGFAMWPLLVCSIIGVAIIGERFLYFYRIRLNYSRFSMQLRSFFSEGNVKECLIFCNKYSNPVSKIAGLYLKNLKNNSLRNEILKREGSLALERVETRLRVLAVLTHIAPFLGLLGTVTGLVGAFHKIEILGGQVQPSDLASGIWEALITTVFGLVIAIPCMAAYHGFENAADKIARRMQFIVSELDEFFSKHFTGSFKIKDVEITEKEMEVVH